MKSLLIFYLSKNTKYAILIISIQHMEFNLNIMVLVGVGRNIGVNIWKMSCWYKCKNSNSWSTMRRDLQKKLRVMRKFKGSFRWSIFPLTNQNQMMVFCICFAPFEIKNEGRIPSPGKTNNYNICLFDKFGEWENYLEKNTRINMEFRYSRDSFYWF